MKRGELYKVYRGSRTDTKDYRVFVVVSRQILIDSKFSTVTCAPVYSSRDGLSTQVPIGPEEGLKHDGAIHCDELVSIPKKRLSDNVGALSPPKLALLGTALRIALAVED
ncbi:MAG: type II toxin-antitoxin system PemK/MazF family toxin [Treponema sp.]|nr:type II toxin-antitoxin system PemK/MazF family toxin [Treponema sp.]